MCKRLDQNDIARLLRHIEWPDGVVNCSQSEPRTNAFPGTLRPILCVEDGQLVLTDRHWGYRASWAETDAKIAVAFNTRLSKVCKRYWSGMLKRGRVLVPANGWYEWTGPKGSRQMWHLHRMDEAPLWIAGLASTGSSSSVAEANGFTVIADDGAGGIVDPDDLRPVVLSMADAILWLDPATAADEAEHILRTGMLETGRFAWHEVVK